jgi:hypothetical protein
VLESLGFEHVADQKDPGRHRLGVERYGRPMGM